MFKHILVPTDGSPLSQNAVRAAASLARECGARITGLYAKPESHTYITEGLRIDEVLWTKAAALDAAQAKLALDFIEETCRAADVPVSTVTATSDLPYQVIINTAKEQGCDLIFMASHGRSGLGALLLGSETHKVLTHSAIPVLVFR